MAAVHLGVCQHQLACSRLTRLQVEESRAVGAGFASCYILSTPRRMFPAFVPQALGCGRPGPTLVGRQHGSRPRQHLECCPLGVIHIMHPDGCGCGAHRWGRRGAGRAVESLEATAMYLAWLAACGAQQ